MEGEDEYLLIRITVMVKMKTEFNDVPVGIMEDEYYEPFMASNNKRNAMSFHLNRQYLGIYRIFFLLCPSFPYF